MTDLLNKYFEGETSAAEEQELRRFFASEEVPDNLKVYKPLFAYIDEEIDKQKTAENIFVKKSSSSKRKILYYISAAAACVLIFLSIGLFNQQNELPCIADGSYVIIDGRCYSDAQLVKSMAFKALSEVSVPIEEYFPDKKTLNQQEIMHEQLKEFSNIFTQ